MTWKVIKIIDSYRLVINAGAINGINKGTKLQIYEPGEEISDPDTGAVLGTLDTVKCYLEATDVFDKMSICVNADNTMSSVGELLFSGLRHTLPVDNEEISGGLKPKTPVKVGDLVRKAK